MDSILRDAYGPDLMNQIINARKSIFDYDLPKECNSLRLPYFYRRYWKRQATNRLLLYRDRYRV